MHVSWQHLNPFRLSLRLNSFYTNILLFVDEVLCKWCELWIIPAVTVGLQWGAKKRGKAWFEIMMGVTGGGGLQSGRVCRAVFFKWWVAHCFDKWSQRRRVTHFSHLCDAGSWALKGRQGSAFIKVMFYTHTHTHTHTHTERERMI